ncbi:MAG: CAAX prenyl protease-related protein [Bryobacteraceae bacterium]
MTARPWIAYVLPFAALLTLLAVGDMLLPGRWEYPVRTLILALTLLLCSRRAISLRTVEPLASIGVGLGVFGLWIAPDVLWPGWRDHWIFQNQLTGPLVAGIPEPLREDPIVIVSRTIRAALLVPVIEELFWRGFLVRWLIHRDFLKVPLGSVTANSFFVTTVMFAAEHGPHWDVGLLAGVIYNVWMVRTRSLGDCILAHAVTNAALSAYVLCYGKWEYW